MTIAVLFKATLTTYNSGFLPENMLKYTRNLANGTNSPCTYLILQSKDQK